LTFLQRKKSLALAGNQIPGCPGCSLGAIPTMQVWLKAKWCTGIFHDKFVGSESD